MRQAGYGTWWTLIFGRHQGRWSPTKSGGMLPTPSAYMCWCNRREYHGRSLGCRKHTGRQGRGMHGKRECKHGHAGNAYHSSPHHIDDWKTPTLSVTPHHQPTSLTARKPLTTDNNHQTTLASEKGLHVRQRNTVSTHIGKHIVSSRKTAKGQETGKRHQSNALRLFGQDTQTPLVRRNSR